MKRKNLEKYHTRIPRKHMWILFREAKRLGITCSWLIRCLLYNSEIFTDLEIIDYHASEMHRFNVCFYGDKEKWKQYGRTGTPDLAKLIRALVLKFVENPNLDIDFLSVFSIKQFSSFKRTSWTRKRKGPGYAYAYHFFGHSYRKDEYWPINKVTNLGLMANSKFL